MTREELKELGLEGEVLEKVMTLHGNGFAKLKTELEETTANLVATQEELGKRDKDIDELRNKSESGDEFKAELEKLQQEYSAYRDESKQREHDIKFNSALGLAIAKSGTIDEVSLKANLDLQSIELTDEGLKGFDEQLVSLKENKKFLFGNKLDGGLEHGKAVPKSTIEEAIKKGFQRR